MVDSQEDLKIRINFFSTFKKIEKDTHTRTRIHTQAVYPLSFFIPEIIIIIWCEKRTFKIFLSSLEKVKKLAEENDRHHHQVCEVQRSERRVFAPSGGSQRDGFSKVPFLFDTTM